MVHSVELQKKLQQKFPHIPVVLSMRYGGPSIKEGLRQLRELGADRVLTIPLFPQYASATTGSLLELIFEHLKREENVPALQVKAPFFDDPGFVDAMAALAPKDLQSYDRVLFSFHGYPEKYLKKSSRQCLTQNCCDQISARNSFCYRAQSVVTAKLLAQRLNLAREKWEIGFQSRLAGSKWTDPYTDEILERWAKEGIKSVLVFCPSFVADCLETVEEIGIRERENFLKLGGARLDLVPCVNASPAWVDSLGQEIQSFIQ
jgi:ferrochelatase